MNLLFFLFSRWTKQSYIGKFESGKAFPDFMTGVEIIRALGLDVNEVVSQVYAQARKKSR